MEQFFAFIFWVGITLLVIRLFFKYIFPFLLRRWVKKQDRQYNTQNNNDHTYKEDTTYQSAPKKKSSSNKNISDIAEDVDFEE